MIITNYILGRYLILPNKYYTSLVILLFVLSGLIPLVSSFETDKANEINIITFNSDVTIYFNKIQYPINNESFLSFDNNDMKRISIKAEDAGSIFYYIGGHVGPIWLPNKPIQFTIYEGNTEIIVDDELQNVSDIPFHVFLIDFFGIGPFPQIRMFRHNDPYSNNPLQLFGYCKDIILTPYNENGLDVYDQPLFNVNYIEELGQTAWGLTSADFNKDGWMDFAASWATDPWPDSLPDIFISIYYNNKDDSFNRVDVYTHDWEEWGYFEDLSSVDFDNDGDVDLLFSLSESINQLKTNGTIYISFNNGDNSFNDKILIARHISEASDLFGRFNPQLTTSDYDLDGDIDFLVGDNSGMVELYLNNGNGTFISDGVINDFGCHSWGLTSMDYDKDGDIDFLVAAALNNEEGEGYIYLKQNKFFESNGSTIFDLGYGNTLLQYSSVQGGASIQSIDYNNDGYMDLIVGLNDALYVCIMEQDDFKIFPLNKFSRVNTNDIRFGGLTVADYNNDGREDLITGGVQGDIRLFWNNYSEILSPLWPKIYNPVGEYEPAEELECSFLSQDVNGHDLFYLIDWGDGSNTGWIGPYPSGEVITIPHVWFEEGGYWIRAKAKNSNGFESGWTNYRFIMTDDIIDILSDLKNFNNCEEIGMIF